MTRPRRQAPTPGPAARPAAAVPQPAAISDAEMSAHLADGQATPLSQVVPFLASYHGTWWLSTQAGWLPVPPAIAAVLDQHAQRLRSQDAMIAARQATIRAVIDLARQAGSGQEPGN
jgi:hypothetical protein